MSCHLFSFFVSYTKASTGFSPTRALYIPFIFHLLSHLFYFFFNHSRNHSQTELYKPLFYHILKGEQADILREFLEKHRAEVKHVILTEYDEELHSKTLYEEGLSIGVQAFRQSLLQYIGRKWPITEELKEKIEAENSLETLQHRMTLAWDCNSIEELSRQILPPDALPS